MTAVDPLQSVRPESLNALMDHSVSDERGTSLWQGAFQRLRRNPGAIIVRMTRASVLEVLNEDYVRTANAKGLAASLITRRHVLRNAMLPVVTTIGLQTGLLFSGAVLTESVFAFNGIGSYLFAAITSRDYPVLQGFILFIALMYALINLLVDITYGLLDPRVRVS